MMMMLAIRVILLLIALFEETRPNIDMRLA